jgi:signal transduction histidine kinase/ActR/RegA family two-component response regulator
VPYRAFRRKLTATFFAPFALALLMLVGFVLWGIYNQATISAWIEHSDQVMFRAKDAEVDLREMQMAYRGYFFVSPEPQHLAHFEGAHTAFNKDLSELVTLVADNSSQEALLSKITESRDALNESIERLIAQRKTAPITEADVRPAQEQADTVYAGLEDFLHAERQLRADRAGNQRSAYRILFALVPLISVMVMAILSYWGWREIQVATEQFHVALDNAEQARAEAEKAGARAEKANRTKDNFLGTVSHELRNPLNSILLWSAALLRDKTLSESTRRGVTAIERAVRVQSQLIEDLLDISRIESGRLRLDVQTVNLAEVVKAGVESMRAAAEAKSIALEEILDPRVDSIAGDPGRLQQIVWNLVSNAVKFTPKGGKVQIRLERVNSHVEIIVADTGKGIDAASIGSVFERFWQGDESGQHGVGLGLSIVKELVSLHGGTISAHSEGPGKGSSFVVKLPLPVGATGAQQNRRHPTGIGTGENDAAPQRLDGLSILVVDDDVDTCDALQNLLGALGASVTAATSARTALSLLDKLKPDAVISDIGMPVEDGYFFARELRKREKGKSAGMPLIALTAFGRVEDKVQILTAGFDSHAVKPIDPVELSAILNNCITARRGAERV